mmetsp:Transcript_84960/g.226681  ORF Transcript_84960/g.226681 Transcript_84960/m.226681 type:complete len:90 (-) Transcript_84960:495-764(-)
MKGSVKSHDAVQPSCKQNSALPGIFLLGNANTSTFRPGNSLQTITICKQKLGLFPSANAIAMGDKEYHSAVNIGATMKARYNNWRHTGW